MKLAEGFSAEAQNYICKLCTKSIQDFHHRLENTASNRKLFPRYTSSVFNAVGLCRNCHTNKTDSPEIRKPTLQEAAMYEYDLTRRG